MRCARAVPGSSSAKLKRVAAHSPDNEHFLAGAPEGLWSFCRDPTELKSGLRQPLVKFDVCSSLQKGTPYLPVSNL